MEMEEKVPDLEICIKLFDLGITKDIKTERIWIHSRKNKSDKELLKRTGPPIISYRSETGKGVPIICPAPDLSELGECLPLKSNTPAYFTVKKRFRPCEHAETEEYYFNYKGFTNRDMATGEETARRVLTGSHDKKEVNCKAILVIHLSEYKIANNQDHQEALVVNRGRG